MTPPLIRNPFDLGFEDSVDPQPGFQWTIQLGQRRFGFRILRTFDELTALEPLQREVFGFSDLDLAATSALVGVAETGGDVIAAYLAADPDKAIAGMATGFGGYHHGVPRFCSDMLAVRPEHRSSGLGAALKRLQAGIALERGFEEMVWTVDPLRAANARLNFEKLGAYSNRYERNRYGATFGQGLYGGLPSDRLHVTWPLHAARVQRRLAGFSNPHTTAWTSAPRVDECAGVPVARVPIPADIDQLLAGDAEDAHRWRMAVRGQLEPAFENGYAVAGFTGGGRTAAEPALVLVTNVQELLMEGEDCGA